MTHCLDTLTRELALYEEARRLQADAKAAIATLGPYDGGAHGAAGEVYSEEVLGMVKAPASLRDIDGWVDGVAVPVKANVANDAEHFRSRNVELDAACAAERVVVILIHGADLIHHGTFDIADLRGSPTTRHWKPTGKVRYNLRVMPAPVPAALG